MGFAADDTVELPSRYCPARSTVTSSGAGRAPTRFRRAPAEVLPTSAEVGMLESAGHSVGHSATHYHARRARISWTAQPT